MIARWMSGLVDSRPAKVTLGISLVGVSLLRVDAPAASDSPGVYQGLAKFPRPLPLLDLYLTVHT